nr:putative spermatogenesis-associated protein 31D3 [Microcebus murinus]XP_012596274.1 putative spermatogenesis-associated protein 31D3 [Microcebus murinus]
MFSPGSAREPSPLFPPKRGTDPPKLTVSAFFWWQPHAQDLFPSKWAPCDFKKQLLALHYSEASFAGDPAASLGVSASLSLPNSALLALWERLVRKRGQFLMWKGKEDKVGSILKQLRPGDHLTASGTTWAAAASQQGAAGSLPRCRSEGKAAELHLRPQPLRPDTWEDDLQQKQLELLLSLRGESLHSVVLVRGSCLPTFVFLTTIASSFKAEGFLAIDRLQLLCLPQTLPQSQSLTLTQVWPLAPFQPPLPIPPPGPLCPIRICGVSLHKAQNAVRCLVSSDIPRLHWNMPRKDQETVWGLCSTIRKFLEDFCPSVPSITCLSQSSKVSVPISVLPGDFSPSTKLQKKTGLHRQPRLIPPGCGSCNTCHTRGCRSLLSPRRETPDRSVSICHGTLSWVSFIRGHGRKDIEYFVFSPSGSFQETSSKIPLKKNSRKDQE